MLFRSLGGSTGTQSKDSCFSTPAFWNNNLYFVGNNDVVKQFTLDPSSGLMSTTPVNQGSFTFGFPGAQPVVSSNGNSNAIVWTMDYKTVTLHAYDAKNVSNALYSSPALGTGVKWTVPTVINGKVYVGTQTKLVVLGILPSGSCNAPSSPGAIVCTPTQGSTVSSPISISGAGTPANGTLARLELWIDGKKIGNYYSSTFQASVAQPSGSHGITVVEVDSKGGVLKSAKTTVTVQ